MEEYEEDGELKWIDPKKFDKDNESLQRIITVPAEMEFFILKQNQLHFRQSEHESTPFTTESMKQKFNWNTSTVEAEKVLEGAYDDDVDEELTKIMKLIVLYNCVQITPLKMASPEITVQQLRGKLKVWQESTTTSPSRRHLGHYKRLFTVIDKSLKVEERKELKKSQEKIAGCYVTIINYVICHNNNYSYKRW